jgi:hypothetical protein
MEHDNDLELDIEALKNQIKQDVAQPKLTPDQLHTALDRYVNTLNSLNVQQFRKGLHEIMARNVYFKDPFNEVRGLADVEDVFAKLFADHPNATLRVHTHAGSGDTGYVEWRLFYTDASGQPQHRNVISKLLFDENGKVRAQMDYWDSGEYYFRRLPVLGPLLDWLARRKSA